MKRCILWGFVGVFFPGSASTQCLAEEICLLNRQTTKPWEKLEVYQYWWWYSKPLLEPELSQERAFPLAFIWRARLQSLQPVAVTDKSLLILSQERSRDLEQRLGRPAFCQEERVTWRFPSSSFTLLLPFFISPEQRVADPSDFPSRERGHIKQAIPTGTEIQLQ